MYEARAVSLPQCNNGDAEIHVLKASFLRFAQTTLTPLPQAIKCKLAELRNLLYLHDACHLHDIYIYKIR